MLLLADPILLLKAALLGIIEGLTEFIPVSSTGHLIVAQNWLRFTGERENAFIIFIQLGAILAVVVQYRAQFMNLAFGWHKDPAARRLIGHLLLGTLPAVLIGLPTNDWIEAHFFNPLAVALALVVGGGAILLVEAWYARSQRGKPNTGVADTPASHGLSASSLTTMQALGVGLFQVLALLFPGTSRSGATIMGGLILGLSRTAATEFSFFLAVPALLGATAVKLHHARHVLSVHDAPMFAVGFVVSFLVAWVVIRALIAFVSHNTFRAFAWYRIAFGVLLLWFFRNSHF